MFVSTLVMRHLPGIPHTIKTIYHVLNIFSLIPICNKTNIVLLKVISFYCFITTKLDYLKYPNELNTLNYS